jgi:hypothetical protein
VIYNTVELDNVSFPQKQLFFLPSKVTFITIGSDLFATLSNQSDYTNSCVAILDVVSCRVFVQEQVVHLAKNKRILAGGILNQYS